MTAHNPNWPSIAGYPYRILIIVCQKWIKYTYMQKIYMKQNINF